MDAHVPSTRPQCIWVQFLWWNNSVIYVVTGNKVDLPNLVDLSVNYLHLSDNCVDLSDLHLTCVPWNSCGANKSIAWQTDGRTTDKVTPMWRFGFAGATKSDIFMKEVDVIYLRRHSKDMISQRKDMTSQLNYRTSLWHSYSTKQNMTGR